MRNRIIMFCVVGSLVINFTCSHAEECRSETEIITNDDCDTILTKDECITTTKHKSGHSHGHRCVWSDCENVCVQGDDSYDCKW